MSAAQRTFPRSFQEPGWAEPGKALTARRNLRLAPIHEIRARRILESKLTFIYDESFDLPDAKRTILGSPVSIPTPSPARSSAANAAMPPYLASLFRDATLLSREQETDLFRRMNYLKYRASKLRDGLDPARPRPSELDEIERLLEEALAIKNQIIQANLRLVVAIAKKRVSPTAELFELVSDGNVSLMQAVEKFNFARGFKFSTYASWAIIRNFARSLPAERERRERYVTGHGDLLEIVSSPEEDDEYDSDRQREQEAMRGLLGRLDPREQHILANRYGLDGAEKKTLVELGRELGVTKERVRQLELRARNKLRKYSWVRRTDSSD